MHEDEYLSPASRLIRPTTGSFANFPPTFVVYGGAERLGMEIRELFSRIRLSREEHVPDHLLVSHDAVHDFTIFPWFATEAGAVYEEMDEWLRLVLGDGNESGGSDDDSLPERGSKSAPTSPVAPTAMERATLRRQTSLARRALRSAKSPRLPTHRDTPRQMYSDMRVEGLHLLDLDLEPLDIGTALVSPFTPFTAQYEQGEFSWEESPDGGAWHEFGGKSGSASEDEEDDE
jgi:hypothetical protein